MYASSSISPVGEGFGHSFEKRSVSLTKWCFVLSLGKIWLWFWRTVYIQRGKQTELWFRWAKNLKAHTHTWIYLHLMNLLKISEIHRNHFMINQNSTKRFIILLKFTSIYLDQLDNCVWSRAQVPVIGLSGQWNPYTNTSRGMCSPKHNSLLVHSGGPFSCLACSIWTPLTIPFYLLIEEKQLKGNKNVLFLHVLSNTGYRHLSS